MGGRPNRTKAAHPTGVMQQALCQQDNRVWPTRGYLAIGIAIAIDSSWRDSIPTPSGYPLSRSLTGHDYSQSRQSSAILSTELDIAKHSIIAHRLGFNLVSCPAFRVGQHALAERDQIFEVERPFTRH